MKLVVLFVTCLVLFALPVLASDAPPTTSPEKVGSTAGMQFEQGWNYFKAGTGVCTVGQILNEIQADGGGALIATEIWVWEQNAWKQYSPSDTTKINQDTLLAFFSNQRLFFNLDPAVCTKNDAARQVEIGKLRSPNSKSFLDTVIDGVKNQFLAPFGLQKDIDVSSVSAEFATFSDSLKVIGQTQLADTTIGGSLTVGLLHFDDMKAEISSLTGKITIAGDLEVTGKIMGSESMRGTLLLDTDMTSTVSAQTWTATPSSVVVTPSYNTKVWVEDLGTSGFTVKVDSAPATKQKLYWMAIW